MMPTIVAEQAPVRPPAYHRAQARLGAALHIDAPPLPAGPGGAPRTYREESLLLIALFT